MELDVVPAVTGEEQQALLAALEAAGIDLDGPPPSYLSAWRAAGLEEATENGDADGYTLSPRKTRGATRA